MPRGRFEEIGERFRRGRSSSAEAAERGCAERAFRRPRARYEAEGSTGLSDRRLGRTLRPHAVKVTVQVRCCGDDTLALLHGTALRRPDMPSTAGQADHPGLAV